MEIPRHFRSLLLLALLALGAVPESTQASPPGANGLIAFSQVDRTNGDSNIWTSQSETYPPDRRQLTATGRDSRPAWSPDGQQIAFERQLGPGSFHRAIFVMDKSG